MLIVFEGIDFSGKSTQISLLSLEMKKKHELIKFPREDNRIIRDYLEGKNNIRVESSFFYFLADIIDGIHSTEEEIVLCDRYVYSTIAYSRVIGFEDAKEIIKLSPVKKADLVLFLDIGMEEYSRRINREMDEYEKNLELEKTAKERFESMCKENFLAKKWVKIDSSRSVEEIHEEIKKILSKSVSF